MSPAQAAFWEWVIILGAVAVIAIVFIAILAAALGRKKN